MFCSSSEICCREKKLQNSETGIALCEFTFAHSEFGSKNKDVQVNCVF